MSRLQGIGWGGALVLALVAVQCGGTTDPRTASTQRMAERLHTIADTTQRVISPEALSRPAGRETGEDPFARAERRVTRAQTLLHAGRAQQAIDVLRAVQTQLRNGALYGFGTNLREIQALLAAAHLRRAQEENCLDGSATASCLLFPLARKDAYPRESHARSAIELFTKVLERTRRNREARWLLNLAHMTVGQYPGQVPDSLVIPPRALASEHEVAPFTDVAPDVGLAEMGLSGGSILEDFDGDGDLDAMASSWGLNDQLRYYRNDGSGTFTDRTVEAGLEGLVGGLNLVHGDYNNDGAADVLVLRGAWHGEAGTHPNSLLRNNGDGTFSDVTEEAGLMSFHPTQTAAWGDYNNDGHLDLFIGNETTAESPHPCELYRNNGDGTFTNVAERVGLDVRGFVKGTTWGDINNDGRLDLYLSRLGEPNLLFRNDGAGDAGPWRFTEISQSAGVREPRNSFPTWFWDYNNDGRLDLFVSGFGPGYQVNMANVVAEYLGDTPLRVTPRLYRNEGNGRFRDVTAEANLNRVLYGMGANYGDIDNDGFPDAYVGTGGPRFTSLIPNRLFRNENGNAFQEVTAAARVGHVGKGHGVSFGDVDADGDQDVFTVLGGAMPGDTYRNALFQNPGTENRWIMLRLEGVSSNAGGVGARIRVVVEAENGRRDIHTMVSSGGSFGASSLRQHIGLGEASALRIVEVRWPTSGTVQTFRDVAMNRRYRVREGVDQLLPVE